MSFFISNKIQFLHKSGTFTNGVSNAGYYKRDEARRIQRNKPECVAIKTRNSDTGKNYSVVTKPVFIGRDGRLVETIDAALPFEMINDARDYIIKNNEAVNKLSGYMIIDKGFHIHKILPIAQSEKLIDNADAERIKFTTNTRKIIYDKSGGVCQLCGLPLGNDWNVDHIIPLSKGGTNSIDNLRATHRSCNEFKGNRSDNEMYQAGSDIMCKMAYESPLCEESMRMIRSIVRGMLSCYKVEFK